MPHPSPLHPWFSSCAFSAPGMLRPAGQLHISSIFKDLHPPNLSGSDSSFSVRSREVKDLRSPILSGSETSFLQELSLSSVSDVKSPILSGSETSFSQRLRYSLVKDLHSPIRSDSGHHPSPRHPWFFSCAFKASSMFCPAGVELSSSFLRLVISPNRSGSDSSL